tara:strand:+ start:425 stop:2590 length:2166 start_codon:yes stop_codon:yes gene_type:complete
MRGTTLQTPTAGGIETRVPGNPQNAQVLDNWTIDPSTGGWSSRVGYERFRPQTSAGFQPFDSTGPITSLHVAQHLAQGARQLVMFEADGALQMVYDIAGTPVRRTLQSGRHTPTATEAGSWYTDVGDRTIVTNGVDRPVIVRPWPLGNATEASNTASSCVRALGFAGAPSPVEAMRNEPMDPGTQSQRTSSGGRTSLWCSFSAQVPGETAGVWGLGFPRGVANSDEQSVFDWSISYLTDTGSESPLSAPATLSWTMPETARGFRAAIALRVPTGPDGTVGRVLYRSRNYSDDYVYQADNRLFEVGRIYNNADDLYFDAVRTSSLIVPAPTVPTVGLPAPRARFSAFWAGVLWLDGGLEDADTLYYSRPGRIEEFAADGFLRLGGQTAGGITAIFPHYAALVVFRENAVDVVTGNAAEGFQSSTIATGVTCRAPHSVAAVPGLGLVFLALDGVYAIVGGLQGGATFDVVKLTTAQRELIDRITPDLHPKAVGVFSPKSREYHVYAPADGQDRPSLGLVLHVDLLETSLSPWSTRTGFPVGAIATMYDGTVVFGHHTGVEAGAGSEAGVFLITQRRAMGGTVGGDNAFTYGAPPTSVYRSTWNDFSDAQQNKQILYVTVWVLTTGQPTVTVKHLKDFSLQAVEERSYLAQPPDAANLPTFDTATLGTPTAYRKARLVPLRVSVAQMSCSWFAFEMSTTDDLVLVGYEVEYQFGKTRVIAGKRA